MIKPSNIANKTFKELLRGAEVYSGAYKYTIGSIHGKLELLNKLYGTTEKDKLNKKRYLYKCIECSYVGIISEANITHGKQCPCCCHNPQVVVEHVNSIVANEDTHWMVDYFKGGWNEAKMYTPNHSKYINMVCPYCGSEIYRSPNYIKSAIKRNTSVCSQCSHTYPFGERCIREILKIKNIKFKTRKKFKWSSFENSKKEYDFYVIYNGLKIIIEVNGIQHYGRSFSWSGGRTAEEEKENDMIKYKLAIENGIDEYYVIDARESTFSHIIKSLHDCGFISFFSVTDEDLSDAFSNTFKPMECEIIEYYRKNITTNVSDIANEFLTSKNTVNRILNKYKELS